MQKQTFVALIIIFVVFIPLFYIAQKRTPEHRPFPLENPRVEESSDIYYPMNNYSKRLNFRWFGKYVAGSEQSPICGKPFMGYHTADDLEVTDEERKMEVPFYSSTNGVVILLESVRGYGGLLVVSSEIDGEKVTLNYGHIDIESVNKKIGDVVKAGEKLGNLGEECSPETDSERKHLHFGISRGAEIDARGYVSLKMFLEGWINPAQIFNEKKARSPKLALIL